jgi:RimJ/RimL family protein N-acetyltransferase
MIHHDIRAALARERQNTLLAEAEAARRARQARPRRQRTGASVSRSSPLSCPPNWLRPGWRHLPGLRPRPAATGERVMLRDGSKVLIRQVQSADAPLLADGFARLSATSRRMRFLTPKRELSPAELRYFTDVDHHDHEALGALDRGDGRGVGIARYIRQAEDPHTADIAVTIVDAWQGRGLGTELLTRLSDRAHNEGIRCFTALVAADNAAVIGLLRTMGASLARRESSTLEYEITLAPSEEHHHDRRVLLSRSSAP